MNKPNTLRAFIVDDNESFRNMLKLYFEETGYIQIVGESETADDFLKKMNYEHPDFITMDIKLKESNGIDATKIALKQHPSLKIIAISMYDDDIYYRQMYNAGAFGFLNKTQVFDQLEKVISKISNGEKYFPFYKNEN